MAGKRGVKFETRQALRSHRVHAALVEEMWHLLVTDAPAKNGTMADEGKQFQEQAA